MNNQPLFLGIEGGATRSVAILADVNGRCFRRLELKTPGNLRLLDEPQLLGWLRDLAHRLPPPATVGIGMAGVLGKTDRDRVRAASARIWPGLPCWVGNDLETALAAASDSSSSARVVRVIVISGTGAACYGQRADGRAVLTGGWGHLFGDRGSGYDMALRACQAVFRRLDESGRWPALGARFLRALHLNSPHALIAWAGDATKPDLAALAIELFAAAAGGDRIARLILEESAEAIARAATACARRLAPAGRPVEFVLAGSILLQQRSFAHRVARQLLAGWPRASVRLLAREGAWGAAVLAQPLWRTPPGPAAPRTVPRTCPARAKTIPPS